MRWGNGKRQGDIFFTSHFFYTPYFFYHRDFFETYFYSVIKKTLNSCILVRPRRIFLSDLGVVLCENNISRYILSEITAAKTYPNPPKFPPAAGSNAAGSNAFNDYTTSINTIPKRGVVLSKIEGYSICLFCSQNPICRLRTVTPSNSAMGLFCRHCKCTCGAMNKYHSTFDP